MEVMIRGKQIISQDNMKTYLTISRRLEIKKEIGIVLIMIKKSF